MNLNNDRIEIRYFNATLLSIKTHFPVLRDRKCGTPCAASCLANGISSKYNNLGISGQEDTPCRIYSIDNFEFKC